MSDTELKETKANLVAWIAAMTDTNMPAVLDGLMKIRHDHDWWDDLDDAQKDHLNEGLKDAECGNVYTSEAFWTLNGFNRQ